MSRLIIAGTNSGCGKTTVTCAVLQGLLLKGLEPAAFKCGPDYIDPMFHRAWGGIKAWNLDPFFLNGEGLRKTLAEKAEGNIAVIEGAMGYYDGIGVTCNASCYTVAKETETPAVLVVDARGSGHSLTAIIEGFLNHREGNNIKGVIFNCANESRYNDLGKIAKEAGVKAYGYMPKNNEWEIKSRRMGLIKASEIADIKEKLRKLGAQAFLSLDIDGLIHLAATAPEIKMPEKAKAMGKSLRLGVAKDEAFCFIYEENLELFESLGCETVFFSPVNDKYLPEGLNGLYLPGGYPELYLEKLSANSQMRESIREAVLNGLPTMAEGGGFLYLHDELEGFKMCGVIKGKAFDTGRLSMFGYVTLTAGKDNLLCKAGESIPAHEFHYFSSDNLGGDFTAIKAGKDLSYKCIYANDTLYAGFPQMYLPARPEFARRFAEKMRAVI